MQNDFLTGLSSAVTGSWTAINNPSFQSNVKKMVLPYLGTAGGMYAIAIGLIIFFLPIALWAPGLVSQLLLLIPFWSFTLSQKLSPRHYQQLFLVIFSSNSHVVGPTKDFEH